MMNVTSNNAHSKLAQVGTATRRCEACGRTKRLTDYSPTPRNKSIFYKKCDHCRSEANKLGRKRAAIRRQQEKQNEVAKANLKAAKVLPNIQQLVAKLRVKANEAQGMAAFEPRLEAHAKALSDLVSQFEEVAG